MTNDREIEEAVARCISIAVFYHNSRKVYRSEELFEDDARSVAHWVAGAGLDEREADRKIFQPLHAALVARYGAEIGSGLRAEFLAAYRDAWRSERPGQVAPPRPRVALGRREARWA